MRARARWIGIAATFVIAALFSGAAHASPVVITLADWRGEANATPCLCPVLEPLSPPDTKEFDVPNLAGSLSVNISWDADLLYDLDLYVDRETAPGSWTEVARSASAQLTMPDAYEGVVIVDPVPGKYRARVVNFLSTELDYHGAAWFYVPG